jgi:glycerophosphoryl diester phosphodiesterase
VAERSFSQVAGSLVVVHRGASLELPENTLAAFERAVAVGADAVEFDVRMTSDDVAVVMHDPDVARTTDGARPVHEMTLDEVRGLTIASGHRVPTLDETLAALSGRVAVDIEIKHQPGEPGYEPDRERAVEALVAALTGFEGPVLVPSFSPASLAAARAAAPDLPTGLLTGWSVPVSGAIEEAAAGGHAWALPFAGGVLAEGEAAVRAARAAGIRLGVWITDDPAEAVALMRLGVDAVATNDPARVVAARREAFGS